MISLLFPIITIPYLIKTLGAANYGLLAYHQYLGQFVLVVLDFGFPLYAVSEVARRSEEPEALGTFLSDVYLVKLAVLGLALLALGVAIGMSRIFQWNGISGWLLVAFAGAAAFNSFAPTWLYQGLDTLHRTIIPTLVARSATLISTFILVRSPGDIYLAPLPYLIGALVLFCSLSWRARTHFTMARMSHSSDVRKVFAESVQVFWSRLTIMGYVTVSPVLIKIAAGNEGIAVYNICEKVISVVRMPFDMLSSASYAHFSRDYQPKAVRRFLAPLGIGGLVLALGMSIVGPVIAFLLNNPALMSTQRYLAIYGLALIPISMHGFIGTCVLLTNGKRIELSKSIAAGLLAYALCVSCLWPWMADKIGLAIVSMVLVEVGIFLSRLFFSIKYRLI